MIKKINLIFFSTLISLISLRSIEIRSITYFVGKRFFNPYDFSITKIKQFADIPFKDKISKIREHKFKTIFYPWLILSNLHTTIMTIDLLLKIRQERKTSKDYKITYLSAIKRTFEVIFFKFGYYKGCQLTLEHTLSKHNYVYCPTIDFFDKVKRHEKLFFILSLLSLTYTPQKKLK